MNAESIKEFFIPTKIKILIAVVTIIPALYYIFYSDCYVKNIPFLLFTVIGSIYLPSLGFGYWDSLHFGRILAILLYSIFCYIFACLIAYFYEYQEKCKVKLIKVIFITIIIFILILPFPLLYLDYLNCQNQLFIPQTSPELKMRELIERCEEYCKKSSSLDYCTNYFGKDMPVARVDWDGDGEENELIKIRGNINYNVCEDRIYCFHIIPCERFGENPIEGCAEQLCQEGYRKYGSISLASDYVINRLDLMPTKDMVCKINMDKLPDELNWHKTYFPENVCEKYIETK